MSSLLLSFAKRFFAYLVVLLKVRHGERVGDLDFVGGHRPEQSSYHTFLVFWSSNVVIQNREQYHRVHLKKKTHQGYDKTRQELEGSTQDKGDDDRLGRPGEATTCYL